MEDFDKEILLRRTMEYTEKISREWADEVLREFFQRRLG
jgi:hypothetical protein